MCRHDWPFPIKVLECRGWGAFMAEGNTLCLAIKIGGVVASKSVRGHLDI